MQGILLGTGTGRDLFIFEFRGFENIRVGTTSAACEAPVAAMPAVSVDTAGQRGGPSGGTEADQPAGQPPLLADASAAAGNSPPLFSGRLPLEGGRNDILAFEKKNNAVPRIGRPNLD